MEGGGGGQNTERRKGSLRKEPAVPTQELAVACHQQWETSGGSNSGTGRSDL